MATALHQQSSSLSHNSWHYSHSPTAPNVPSTSSSSSTSLSSSSTPTNTTRHRHSPPATACPPSARKIRFAPLPDPRRSVLITDDGEELPIPNGDVATTITSCPPSPAVYAMDLPVQEISSLTSFGSSSKRNSDTTEQSSASGSTTPASMTNTTNSEASGSEPASPASIPICLPPTLSSNNKPSAAPTSNGAAFPKSKGLSFFRSFKRRSGSSSSSSSSYSLTPTNSIDPSPGTARKGISTEEILTLGTINLFRASSRESGDGWNLTRWASAGPSTGSGGPARNFGVPLTRTQSTQSTQSYKSKTPSLLSGLRPSTAPTPKSAKQAIPNRKGTRMLNGRVYGGKRDPNHNPFANARDDEPTFVEWGYGGMGSVKGAKSAGVAGAGWEKLGGSPDDDLEDATGTAWVRKRKEAREKKAREEREAKEKAEKEALEASANGDVEKASSDASGSGEAAETRPELVTTLSSAPTVATITESAQPTPTASSMDVTATRLVNSWKETPTQPSTPTIPATPSREAGPSPMTVAAEDDHIFTTMAVPIRPHHRTRSASNATFTHILDGDNKLQPAEVLVKVESESESDSEASSDSDQDEEEDDDDDEDDDEEAEAHRRMVLGAGMEKVSRHRDDKS